jgi:hypothetical protein
VLTAEQALDVARVISADVISDEEAARLLEEITGWPRAQAVEFVKLARNLETAD